MARFNEILVGRYNRSFQKLFGLKGGPPASQLATEIGLQHTVFTGVENRYLESWGKFGFFLNTGVPGAGNRAAVRLRNPIGSNLIVVVEKVTIVEGALDVPQMTLDTAQVDLTTFRQGIAFDTRGNPSSGANISASANAGPINSNTIWQGGQPANTAADVILYEDHQITLLPNSALTVWAATLVVSLQVSFWWRERFLEEGERT
jgi:hypothetical protein